MAALAGEITAALHGSIKKASLEALENTAEVNRVIREAGETILKNTDEADTFVIETRNIFKTCDSCKRELLMLQEYLKLQGKRLDIVIYSDDTIKGTAELKKFIK